MLAYISEIPMHMVCISSADQTPPTHLKKLLELTSAQGAIIPSCELTDCITGFIFAGRKSNGEM